MSGVEVAPEPRAGAPSRTLELRRGEAAPPSPADLKEVAQGFEALFAGTILSELLKPLNGSGFAGSGPGASIVQGLIETHLADHFAKGGGFGIGRMIEESMAPLLRMRAVTQEELQAAAAASRSEGLERLATTQGEGMR